MTQVHDHSQEIEESQAPDGADESKWPNWLNAASLLGIFMICACVVWLLTGIYKVNFGEVVVVERMGEFITTETEGGLHFGWPWPIDVVHKIPTGQTLSMSLSEFNQSPAVYAEMKRSILRQNNRIPAAVLDSLFDPYLITGDKNIVNVQIAVQYRIADAKTYLQSVAHGVAHNTDQVFKERENAIRQMALHVLIREIAKTPIDHALYEGRQELTDRLLRACKEEIMSPEAGKANYKMGSLLGIEIDRINVEVIRGPSIVDPAFQDVAKARQEGETIRDRAKAYANGVVTTASGATSRIIGEAEAYRNQMVDEAKGEAERFSRVYAEYRQSPALTKTSLYADTVSKVLQNVTRTIFVQPGQKTNLVLEPVDDRALPAAAGGAGGPAGPMGPGGQ